MRGPGPSIAADGASPATGLARVACWRRAWRRTAAAWVAAAAAGLAVAPARAEPPPDWFDALGPNASARAAVALLADAASHGLDARDYPVPALPAAAEGAPLAGDAVARAERTLTAAVLRYLRDLHDGRVAPAQVGVRFPAAWRAPFDADAALRSALAQGDLAQAVQRAVPALPQYRRLREALARYRALEADPAWQTALAALPQVAGRRVRSVEPGDPWDGVALLGARLVALGDLAPAAAPAAPASAPGGAAPTYDAALVAAVRAFQQRHGLADDGVIGRATWDALQVPPRRRVRQLELALERLRWTPLLHGPRMIVVNVPEFVLRGYEVDGERIAVKVESKVIVGKALDTRTPLIGEELRRIEFQPFWNVPASIARQELVPRLARDPAHWVREGFEFVGGDGRVDRSLGAAGLQAVREGRLRIRQRPGPRNALGDIKFVFPNQQSIYLHHTPSVQLFERARRDFSHGCIRVEQPVALAAFALQGLAGWSEERIRRAMDTDDPSTLALAQPIPVLIAYGTALVKDTRVYFFDDVYGHDRVLDAALRQRPRPATVRAAP